MSNFSRLSVAVVTAAIFCLGASVLEAEPAGTQVTEIEQYGITWKLARPTEAGRFVTGDWWVVGPVEVLSVSPAPTEERNGSVVNPEGGSKHGYDARLRGYDAALRSQYPLTLKPGDALVSVASVDKIGDKTDEAVQMNYRRGPMRTAVVLTCVAAAQPADAFRPAYVGTWRESFRASQLQRDLLPRLKAPGELPDVKGMARELQRIWLDHQRGWINREMHPMENMADYGRDITHTVSNIGLALLLDLPEDDLETLLVRFVQKGIDNYGTTRSNDDLWIADGGHNSGRKWPIVFAGVMLGHEGMMSVKATFQEDRQTYFGKGFKGQRALWTLRDREETGMNNRHEEVDPATWETYGDGSNNGSKAEGYRHLNGPTWMGQALAARIMGAAGEDCWNYAPFFEYVDRWAEEQGDKAARPFVMQMWQTYRKDADALGEVARKKRLAAAAKAQ